MVCMLSYYIGSSNREYDMNSDVGVNKHAGKGTVEGFTSGIRQSIRPHIRSYNYHKNNILSVVNYHKNRVFRYIGM